MAMKIRLRVTLIVYCVVAAACTASPPAPSTAGPGRTAVGTAIVEGPSPIKLNLNTASAQDFAAAIPGLGNRMVREFLEYRPYVSIQQFRREIGKYVDDPQVADYERYVYVPIAVNDSDAATLQQIPGLDAPEAESLIAGRPYASNDAFLVRLAGYVSPAEAAAAVGYLDQP
jgi:DNA uptake protein ComE-like DNA-binding protein